MALIGLHEVRLTFGGFPLFDGINVQLEVGDRFCLLGRNGEGKSTLMKIIAAQQTADSGEIARSPGLQVAYLSQDIPDSLTGTLSEIASAKLAHHGPADHEIDTMLYQLNLDPEASFATQSGGNKRKTLLVQALGSGADIVLLDEPTNHLDIDGILWLEDYLLSKVKTFLFVTHDRAFARRLSNRIGELDRGKLYSFSCGYDTFLTRREELLEAEKAKMKLFEKKLAQEEAWIRRGVKARRVRDEGRVKALKAMREAWRLKRDQAGAVKLTVSSAERSGNLIAETKEVRFGYTELPIIADLSTTLMRGDRVGIIGPNGAGKSTLLKLLLGELQPQSGTIRLGTRQEIIYFDQMRQSLNLKKSVADNVGDGYDTVVVNGRQKHILAYLQDFLFTPDRARSPVEILSGGEKNRLLLAKLFTKPSNILVLDEPTNDLDSETLDLLEDMLLDYQGTLLVVSHDRDFLDNVVTSLLVLEGKGEVIEFAGDYEDWLAHKTRQAKNQELDKAKKREQPISPSTTAPPTASKKRSLNFNESRELAEIPAKIARWEAELAALHLELAKPELYKQGAEQLANRTQEINRLEKTIETSYARWTELESSS